MNKSSKINCLISKLDSGQNISRRALARALGDQALIKIDQAWNEELKSRKYRPPEITEYAKKLKRAMIQYCHAEKASSKRCSTAKRKFEIAENSMELALEYLQDMVSTQPDLQYWIDRPAQLDGLNVNCSPHGMPRPIWSTSAYKEETWERKQRIRDLKRELLEEELQKNEPIPTLETSHSWSRDRKSLDFSVLRNAK